MQENKVTCRKIELIFIKLIFVMLQGNTHNDYLRYGKRILREGYRIYNTSKAIHYALPGS